VLFIKAFCSFKFVFAAVYWKFIQGRAFEVWLFHIIKRQRSRNDNKRWPKSSAKSILLFVVRCFA